MAAVGFQSAYFVAHAEEDFCITRCVLRWQQRRVVCNSTAKEVLNLVMTCEFSRPGLMETFSWEVLD